MSDLFHDGADHYATADILKKYTSMSGVTVVSAGRHGTQCLRVNGSAGTGSLSKTVAPASASTGGVGGAFSINTLFDGSTSLHLIAIKEGGTVHLGVRLLSSGLLAIYRSTSLLGTSVIGLTADTFYYIEFKFNIHDTTGTASLRLNGTEILAISATDTRNGGTGVWDSVQMNVGVANAAINVDIDDLVIWDTDGAENNDFLGPCRVVTTYADGAGNSTDFTPSAGSNFQNVDEALQDGDTTYNSETTAGDHDTYTFGALGVTGVVKAVQTNLIVRSDGGGAETVAPVLRIAGTDYAGAAVGVSTSYLDKMQVYQVSPATGVAFTTTEIDAMEVGPKLVS